MSSTQRMIVWADEGQQDLVRQVVQQSAVDLLAVGSANSDAASKLSSELDTERIADIREAIQRDDCDVLWLAGTMSLDVDERRLIRDVGRRTVSSEPRPGSIADVASLAAEATTVQFVPLMRRSPGFRAAEDILDSIGHVYCFNVCLYSAAGEGSLFARLFDAMDLIESVCGPAELMDASLAGPLAGATESLNGLRGYLTANLRFPGNRCASIAASDMAGSWNRSLTLLGEQGCLLIDDTGFEWTSTTGRLVDSHREDEPPRAAELIGGQIRRLLDHLDQPEPPPDNACLLALCEAVRLSCRTGQNESPRKVLEMLSRP